MVSLLEQLARQRFGNRGGVTYMPPVRIPQRLPPGPPLTPRLGPRPEFAQAEGDWVTPNFGAIANYQTPQADEGGGGGPLGGLGFVIGKGLEKGLQALSVLDYPRAAVTALAREAIAEAEPLNKALAKLPGVEYSPLNMEGDFSWQDIWENTKAHKGFGELIVEPIMGEEGTDRGIWPRRIAGFAGDVATDPLSFTGFGVGAQAGKAERASRLNRLLDAQRAAVEAGDTQLAQRLGDVGTLERIGSRGLSTANPEQLRAMGLEQNAIRWGGPKGIRLPGTQTLSRGLAEVLGAARPIARGVPGAGLLRQAATRKGYLGQDLLPSYERIITGRGQQSMEEALRAVATNEKMRLAGGGFEGRANATLRVLREQTAKRSENDINDAIRAAETGVDNEFSAVAETMREAARQVGGEIPELPPIQLPDGRVRRFAIPHVLSRPFRDYLERGANSAPVEDFKRAAGITTDDLLEESGFLQKRTFAPNPDGTPQPFKIGDQELIVEEGTLAELDSKLRAMFPDYDGPIYERSPVEAWRRYIQGVKRDVGKRSAFRQAAGEGYVGVAPLSERPADWDPFGGRQQVMIGEGDEAEAVQRVIPNPEAKPVNEQYKMVPSAEATKLRNREIGTLKRGPQADILANYETFSRAERERIAGEIDDLAESLLQPVRERRGELLLQEIEKQRQVTSVAQRIEVFDNLRTQVVAELDALENEADQIARAIVNVQRTADRRTRRAQQRLLSELQERWKQLTDENERLTTAYEEAIADIEQRAAAAREGMADLPTERAVRDLSPRRIRQEKKRLTDNERTLRNARDKARTSFISKQRNDGNWIDDKVYQQAEARIQRAANSGELQRYRRLVEDESNARRAGARAYADANDLDTDVARIRRELDQLRREAGRDVTDEMLRASERLEGLETQIDELQRQLDEATLRGDKAAATKLRKTLDHHQHEAERMRIRLDRATPGEMSEQIDNLLSDQRRNRAEAEALRERGEQQLTRADRMRQQINNHALTKAADTRRRYLDLQTRLNHATQAAEQSWQNAKRELDDFMQASAEEAQRLQPPATPRLERNEQATLTRARRVLNSAEATEYTNAQQRVQEINRQLQDVGQMARRVDPEAQAATRQADALEKQLTREGGDLDQLKVLERQHELFERNRPPKDAKLTPRQQRLAANDKQVMTEIINRRQMVERTRAQIAELRRGIETGPKLTSRQEQALRRELKRLTQYLDSNQKLAARITRANETVTAMEQRLAQMGQVEPPRRLPFFEQLDREVAEMRSRLDAANRLPKVQIAQEQRMRVPQIQQVRGELAEAQRGLAGAEREAAQITLREGTEGMEKTRLLRDQAERVRIETAERQGALDRIDNQTGRARETYRMAQNDLQRAREESKAVADAMQGVSTSPERAATMVKQNKREAKAAQTRLELVAKGQMPSYEAQPMNRVLSDLEKLIAANPLGDDAAMHKAESVLHSLRGQLTELTEQADLPARETRKIIKAANDGTLAPVLTAQIADGLRLLWDEGDVVVRGEVAKSYLNIRNGLRSKAFGRLLTTWTNFFKTYATLSPGFHIRNAITAIFMNWTEGVSTREQFRAMQLWREFRNSDTPVAWLARLQVNDPKAYAAFDATFASGTGGQFFESGVGEMANVSGRIKEGIFANPVTKGSQRFGQNWVEGPARLSLALHSTRNGGTATDALQAITRIHFDYSQVSDFDEKAKRVIPFWTFTSRNIPLQFTQMWMRPKMYNRYQSLVRNFGEPLPEFTPEYMEQQGAFNTGLTTPDWLPGAAGGMPILAQPDLPHLRLQEDILRMSAPLRGEDMGQVLSDVNPIFTAPFEYLLGEDFYTGQRYEPTDVSQTTPVGAPMAAIASIFGAGRRGANGEWYIDDKAMNLLNTLLPPLERQSRLLPGLLTETADQGKGDRLAESYARFWLGAPVRTLSEAQQRSEQRRRFYDAREQAQRVAATGG